MKRNIAWKKVMTKAAAMTLTGALLLGLSGCGKESGGSQEASGTSAGTQSSAGSTSEGTQGAQESASGATQAAPEEGGAITYPLQTEDTLTFWHNNQLNYHEPYTSYEESPFHKGLSERTGVTVKWEQPAEAVYGNMDVQAYNLLLTEEVLPDIIFTSISNSEAEQLIADGVIYDLTEYLPKYAPDYWAFISDPENVDYWRDLQTDQGQFFNIATLTPDFMINIFQGPVIRQDWLDECGLDAPVTLEDWEKVITAFKEKYNAPFGYWQLSMDNAGLGSGTGAYGNFAASLYVDDNGKIQLAQTQPEWKEYMEILHSWWDKGLIDKDSVSMDDAAVRQKVLNDQIGISYTLQSRLNLWMGDAAEIGSSANWVALAYPRTAPGEPTSFIQCGSLNRGGSRYSGWGAMITTSCPEEKLATALEFLNYGYTEEGILYWNYGTEGVSYVMDENGMPKFTDLLVSDPAGLGTAALNYIGASGTGLTIRQSYGIEMRMEGNSAPAARIWAENTDDAKHRIPNIALTDEENVTYTDTYNAINVRTSEMALKFLTGEESLDKFDSFVEELYAMGLQDLLDVTQTAYDRYLAK